MTGDPPLAGLRVIDLTHILAGPYATLLLADAGAKVIKVEPPWGEYSRTRGAMRSADGATVSAYSAAVHRGKRSIALDLKNEAGASVLRRLLSGADIVVENLAPGALRRLGFDLGQLRAEHPRLITCSISLYGSAPEAADYRDRGGLAIIAEAESGLIEKNRAPGGIPRHFEFGLGDAAAGLAAYCGIMTALVGRGLNGTGQHVDISMIRALLWINSPTIAAQDIGGAAGTNFRAAALGVFRSSDGFVAIGVNSDGLWQRLAEAMARPELAADSRYAEHTERDSRADEVDEMVSRWSSTMTTAAIIETLSRARVPCGQVNDPQAILDGYLARQLGYIDTEPDGLGGVVRVAANPMGLRRGSGSGIPRCGQHTAEILAEIGMDSEAAAGLRAAGAFG
jgi:crotonobetainyl-CoA:carnitine CoA-transferase CaiB-like acyl-CoA transferase